MRTTSWGIASLGLLILLAACNRDEPFGPGLDAVSSLSVQVFFEYDDNPGFGGGDAPAVGAPVQVLTRGEGTPVVEGSADAQGVIDFPAIPVGTYEIRVDPAFLADSLVVASTDSTTVTFEPNQPRTFRVGLTPPTMSVAEVRALPLGRRVWVGGLALNRRSSSLDGAIHVLEGDSSALRVDLPSASGGSQGDSIRALGTTAGTGSGRHLVNGRINVLAQDVRAVLPLELSIGEARTAGGGRHAARLVAIRSGQVADTMTVPFVGLRVSVQDGTETINLLLATQNGFGTPNLPPGTPLVTATGLLVQDPDVSGVWRIVPLGSGAVSFGPPPPGG